MGVNVIFVVIGLIDSIVDCIDLHDQELVQILVSYFEFALLNFFIIKLFDHICDNFSTIMLVDYSGRTHLGQR